MPDLLVMVLVIAIVLLALDQVAARSGDDSRHEFGDRNW